MRTATPSTRSRLRFGGFLVGKAWHAWTGAARDVMRFPPWRAMQLLLLLAAAVGLVVGLARRSFEAILFASVFARIDRRSDALSSPRREATLVLVPELSAPRRAGSDLAAARLRGDSLPPMTVIGNWLRGLPERHGRKTLILLVAILVVGFGLRAYRVVEPLPTPGDDAHAYYALAKALYEEGSYGGPTFEDSSDWSPGAPLLYAASFYATGGRPRRDGADRRAAARPGVRSSSSTCSAAAINCRPTGLLAAFARRRLPTLHPLDRRPLQRAAGDLHPARSGLGISLGRTGPEHWRAGPSRGRGACGPGVRPRPPCPAPPAR